MRLASGGQTGAGVQYNVSTLSGATFISGTTSVGNACDDCYTQIALPFGYQFYNQVIGSAWLSSNGHLDFSRPGSNGIDPYYTETSLPDTTGQTDPKYGHFDAIFAHWDDLRTDNAGNGIFTSTTGTAPNRIFNVEWRASYYSAAQQATFEIRLYEGQCRFDLLYGRVDQGGSSATVGVQQGTGSNYTQYEYDTANSLTNGQALSFINTTSPGCTSSATATPSTGVPTATATPGAGSALAIDAGGPAAGTFVADIDYTGGTTKSVPDAISTAGVTNPAPQAVYQSARVGSVFTYTVPGLTPTASYLARLHFAELGCTTANCRTFNVTLNGTQVLTNFDIFAASGGKDKAIVQEFTVPADGSGKIVVGFKSVVSNAQLNGLEIFSSGGSTPTTVPATSTNTAVLATATNTPLPANTSTNTPTNTSVPATATNTAVPATATHTPLPANTATNTPQNTPTTTSTNTSVPATSTNTSVPATSTKTAVPATATIIPTTTPTKTSIPATATNTAVSATATSIPNASADLAVTESAAPNPVMVGQPLTFTSLVTNGGPSAASAVVFTATVPASTTFQSLATPSGWTCTTPSVGSTGMVNCTNGSLAAGATASFPLVVLVGSGTTTHATLTGTAGISSGTADPAMANNTAQATTTTANGCPTANTWIGLPYLNRFYTGTKNPDGTCAITVQPHTFSASLTIPGGVTYMESGVTVGGGVTLTVASGTLISVTDGAYSLVIMGTLNTTGTPAAPVTLTSAGAWGGLAFRPGSHGTVAGLHISSAKQGLLSNNSTTYYAGILIEGAAPAISGSSVDTSGNSGAPGSSAGIIVLSGSPTIASSTITGNISDGIWVNGGTPTVSNSTLTGNTNDGIEVVGGTPTLSGDKVNNNTQWAVYYDAWSATNLTKVSGMSGSGNGYNGVGFPGGTVSSTTSWSASSGLPFIVNSGDLIVSSGITLTIAPSSTLLFNGGGLYVAGTLGMAGTATSPISLTTANVAVPAPGQWVGVYFRPGSKGTLSYVHLSYAGVPGLNYANSAYLYTAILIESASPTISNTVIDKSGGNDVEVSSPTTPAVPVLNQDTFGSPGASNYWAVQVDDLPSRLTLTNSTAYGSVRLSALNADAALLAGTQVVGSGLILDLLGNGGTLSGSSTWLDHGAPYRLEGDLIVGAAATLVMSSPLTLQVNGGGLYVAGTLGMAGTATSPISLTTANVAVPAPGQWVGVYFRPGSKGTLSYVHLSYAGVPGLNYANSAYLYTAILIESASPTISNTVIDKSGGNDVEVSSPTTPAVPVLNQDTFGSPGASNYWAVQVDDLPSRLTLTNSTAYGSVRLSALNADAALLAGTQVVGSGLILDLLGNGGTLSGSSTWLDHGAPYRLEGDLIVGAAATLVMSSPLTLQVNGGGLYVAGTLGMTGTVTSPISLTTANVAVPAPGQWVGVYFRPGSKGTLSYVHLSYAGVPGLNYANSAYLYTAILIESASPTISNTVIDKSGGNDVEVSSPTTPAVPVLNQDTFGSPGASNYWAVQVDDLPSRLTLTNSTAFGSVRLSALNADAALLAGTQVVGSGLILDLLGNGGTLSGSSTWLDHGAPYRLEGDLVVGAAATLVMSSPLTLQFNGGGLYVAGTLGMTGTVTSPISLTTATSPAARGQWRGIAFQPGSKGTLSYVHLSYAGSGLLNYANNAYLLTGISIESASPTISNTVIDKSGGHDVEVASPTTPATPVLHGDSLLATISGSGYFGVVNDGGATVDATNSWWGAASGPSGPGGSGSGTPVSTGVNFTPWLTSAP